MSDYDIIKLWSNYVRIIVEFIDFVIFLVIYFKMYPFQSALYFKYLEVANL